MIADVVYARARDGLPSWVSETDGTRAPLPVARWIGGHNAAAADIVADKAGVGLCTGPTLDLGCGPGRLTEALMSAGIRALGVDTSSVAVSMTNARGGIAVEGDIFDDLPGAGQWSHVLLADGNIGIGGDPAALLRRARALMASGGTVVVEVDPPGGRGLHRRRVRWESGDHVGCWFDWATVDAPTIVAIAAGVGLTPGRTVAAGGRVFVELAAQPCVPAIPASVGTTVSL